jgi:rhamnosyltransferase
LLKESGASAYSSSASAFWPSGRKRILKQSNVQRPNDYLFEGAGQGCTFILKYDFFYRIKIFCQRNRFLTDQFYYHDWLVYILARSWNKSWIFDAHSFIEYRQHESNDTGARKGIESIKNRVNLIANGWYKNQVGLAIQIAQIASGSRANLSYIADLFSERDSIRRSINLMIFVLMNGRRKLSDRFVLIIASAVRWL